MTLPMKNCKEEHQIYYFKEYLFKCSLNVATCLLEKNEIEKSLIMLDNVMKSINERKFDNSENL